MNHEFKIFAIKFVGTLLAAPIIGWGLLRFIEKFEATWKTNNRRKKWLVCCGLFLVLAAISGWFL